MSKIPPPPPPPKLANIADYITHFNKPLTMDEKACWVGEITQLTLDGILPQNIYRALCKHIESLPVATPATDRPPAKLPEALLTKPLVATTTVFPNAMPLHEYERLKKSAYSKENNSSPVLLYVGIFLFACIVAALYGQHIMNKNNVDNPQGQTLEVVEHQNTSNNTTSIVSAKMTNNLDNPFEESPDMKTDDPFGEDNDSKVTDDGFESLFDGKIFGGWQGDPAVWRIENEMFIGEIKPELDRGRKASYLIYKKEEFGNLILRFDIKTSAVANSGMQVRSWILPDNPSRVNGYQFDYGSFAPNSPSLSRYGKGGEAGSLYFESQSRREGGFFAKIGEKTEIGNDHNPKIVGTTGDTEKLFKVYKKEQWNQCEVKCEGYTFTSIINGQIMSICTDNDIEFRRDKGFLAIQASANEMKVEIRNIRIKKLP